MRKIFNIFLTITFLIISIIVPAFADEDTENIYASVTVLPRFTLSLDNNYLDFGNIQSGETVVLNPASYYNTIKCVSNKGKKWYLKISLQGDIKGPAGTTVDPSFCKWRIHSETGDGSPVEGWSSFNKEPVFVYTARGEDIQGKGVTIRFQYSLELPPCAKAGHYSIRVLYTLTEEE